MIAAQPKSAMQDQVAEFVIGKPDILFMLLLILLQIGCEKPLFERSWVWLGPESSGLSLFWSAGCGNVGVRLPSQFPTG